MIVRVSTSSPGDVANSRCRRLAAPTEVFMSTREDESGLSRRKFFRSAVAGVVAAQAASHGQGEAHAASPAAGNHATPEFDFTAKSNALQADAIVDGACQFCNSNCRLKIHVKAGRVIDIKGEENDPVQAGELCVKGPMMAQLVYNRLRLTTPLKRVGGEKGSPGSKFEAASG